MGDDTPIKLSVEDIDITIVRTYRLDQPTVIDRGRSEPAVLATLFRITKQTWSWGEHDTEYAVAGKALKVDGTPDKRVQSGWFNLPGPPSLDGFPELAGKTLPDPRQPLLDALDRLADEMNAP